MGATGNHHAMQNKEDSDNTNITCFLMGRIYKRKKHMTGDKRATAVHEVDKGWRKAG